MKFSCEHCRTPYSISDEKVRGKILTIRCRRCQSVIVVRDPEAPTDDAPGNAAAGEKRGAPPPPSGARAGASVVHEAAPLPGHPRQRRLDFDAGEDDFDRALEKIAGESSPPAAPPPVPPRVVPQDTVVSEIPVLHPIEAPPPPSEPVKAPPLSLSIAAPAWFLGVGGEQRGPMTLGELRDVFQRAEAKSDALVWKAGMENWTPAPSVDELKDVVQPVAPPPVERPSVAPAPREAVAAPSGGLSARSPLRIAKPIDPGYSDFGEIGGTIILDAGAILSIEEIPRRRPPSKARVAIAATLGILGVSGAIVGLMVAIGAIDIFGTDNSPNGRLRRSEMLHVEGAGPLVFRDTRIIEVMKSGRRRGGAQGPSAGAPLTGTPPAAARPAADMSTTMRLGNLGGPTGVEPSAEMRRLLATNSGIVESGPIERPVTIARKEKDEPSTDDAQRFQKMFSRHYKRSVTGCYNKALKVDSSLQGSVVLTMELNERSKIKSLAFSRYQGSPFETCVKESSRSWKFAGVSPGTTIEYTINLARTE